jgi:hypothetical protein
MHYPKRTAVNDRTSREGMQDILIDLLLLSRNKHLVASYLSTFPELAWWLGGCQATVSIIETKSAIQSWLAHFQGDETTVVPAGALEVPSAS